MKQIIVLFAMIVSPFGVVFTLFAPLHYHWDEI